MTEGGPGFEGIKMNILKSIYHLIFGFPPKKAREDNKAPDTLTVKLSINPKTLEKLLNEEPDRTPAAQPTTPFKFSSPAKRIIDRIALKPFKITLLAKSSGSVGYPVIFTCKDNHLQIKCGCVAGKFSQFCKHKYQLLDGNKDYLQDQTHPDDLASILAILPHTDFPELLHQYKMALIQGDPASLKEAKTQLMMAMRLGG